MKEFKGRIIAPGTVTAEAVVTHGGFNTLASLQGALQFGDKKATCGDQNNPDLHGKELAGKALCLPQTIGSTTGGLVIYCACAMGHKSLCGHGAWGDDTAFKCFHAFAPPFVICSRISASV